MLNRDNSLDKFQDDGMSMNPYENRLDPANQQQTINITNHIHKTYVNGAHGQRHGDGESEDAGPTAADLNA